MRRSRIVFLSAALLALCIAPFALAGGDAKKKWDDPADARVADDDAAGWVRRIDAILFPNEMTASLRMDVKREKGTDRSYTFTLYRLGRDKTLMEFSEPPLEKGRKMLRLGEDMWMYIPTSKRPIRVSAKQELMGGDFNNGDILRLNLVDDYTAKFIAVEGGGTATKLIELIAKDPSVSYDKVHLLADAKTGMPIEETFFSVSGKPLKKIVFKEVQGFKGHPRPAVMEMLSLLNSSQKTTMHMLDLTPNETLPESRFNRNTLGQ